MLRNATTLQVILTNVLLFTLWHFSMFIACITVKKSIFDPSRPRYQAKEWERGGRWYQDKLRIKKWKDFMPQHVGKDGFSKEHMAQNVSLEYIDQFILETCRGEWDHSMNCLYAPICLFINGFTGYGLLFALLALIGNLPFVAIQRYNRFRLLTVRKRLLRELSRTHGAKEKVMA